MYDHKRYLFNTMLEKIRQKPQFKISFCTTCKGRLHHLHETFLQNIEDNKDYLPVEFILLNYNCPNPLDLWVSRNLQSYLESGLVSYYRYETDSDFLPSHAKNMAFKMAKGDVVCNLDADNFTGKGFANYINDRLHSVEFLSGLPIKDNKLIVENWKGTGGRNILFREIFEMIGGFDEDLTGWGYEDTHLSERLLKLNLTGEFIDQKFLRCIEHDDSERTLYMKNKVTGRGSDRSFGSVKEKYEICRSKIENGELFANSSGFGKGVLIRNFGQKLILS